MLDADLAEIYGYTTKAFNQQIKNYSYIKIYNKNASKDKMLTYLKNNCGITQTLTFGTVAGKYDVVIKKNSFNEMVKRVRKKYEPFIGRNLTKAINNK